MRKDVEDYPDDFLYERARRFKVTAAGIHLALKRLKLSRKKTLKHPSASKELRASFQHRIAQYEKEGRVVAYLDESGFAVDTPRTHGYSLRGTRCYGSCDWHAHGRINVIGACIDMTFINVVLFDGNIDSSYTAKVSKTFYGVQRLKRANEGAIRENIAKLIYDLYAL